MNYRGCQNNGNTRQYRNKSVCVGCTEITLFASIFRHTVCVYAVYCPCQCIYILCLVNISYERTAKMGDLLDFSKRTDCWWTFSWSICNQNGHLIGCIQSSSFQGYDGIHIMGRRHKLSGTVAENQNQVKGIAVHWRGLCLKIIELLHQRWQQTSVFILKTVSTKTVWRELHKSNIRGRAAVAQPPITESKTKRRKRWCDDHKTWRLMIGNT